MPVPLDDVRPGDLVTAQFINDLLATLRELDARVEALEDHNASGNVRITEFAPPSGEGVNMGQLLIVFGSGFLFPPRLNTVSIDGQVIEDGAFDNANSSSTSIAFMVPTGLPDMPDAGRLVPVHVVNENGDDTLNCRVLPELDVEGDAPSISSISGPQGQTETLFVGETGTIIGENLDANPRVTFRDDGITVANSTAEVEVVSATELSITVPDMDIVPDADIARLGINLTLRVTTDHPVPADDGVRVRRR